MVFNAVATQKNEQQNYIRQLVHSCNDFNTSARVKGKNAVVGTKKNTKKGENVIKESNQSNQNLTIRLSRFSSKSQITKAKTQQHGVSVKVKNQTNTINSSDDIIVKSEKITK